jgi:hypothetical protein
MATVDGVTKQYADSIKASNSQSPHLSANLRQPLKGQVTITDELRAGWSARRRTLARTLLPAVILLIVDIGPFLGSSGISLSKMSMAERLGGQVPRLDPPVTKSW